MPPPPGVELRAVIDAQGVGALASVHDEVFGGDHSAVGDALLAGLAREPSTAAARGFRYLQVDASPDSRPILQRLGFVELGTTTPFTHPGGAG